MLTIEQTNEVLNQELNSQTLLLLGMSKEVFAINIDTPDKTLKNLAYLVFHGYVEFVVYAYDNTVQYRVTKLTQDTHKKQATDSFDLGFDIVLKIQWGDSIKYAGIIRDTFTFPTATPSVLARFFQHFVGNIL